MLTQNAAASRHGGRANRAKTPPTVIPTSDSKDGDEEEPSLSSSSSVVFTATDAAGGSEDELDINPFKELVGVSNKVLVAGSVGTETKK